MSSCDSGYMAKVNVWPQTAADEEKDHSSLPFHIDTVNREYRRSGCVVADGLEGTSQDVLGDVS